MAKLTKRQKAIAAAIEANKVYTLEEAVQVLNSSQLRSSKNL